MPIEQLTSFRHYLKADPIKGYDIWITPPTPAFVDGLRYDIWSNGLGFIDMPYKGEKDLLRLVGDSFTFAFAPVKDKWGTRLEEFLGRRVLKCGIGAYGTWHEQRSS